MYIVLTWHMHTYAPFDYGLILPPFSAPTNLWCNSERRIPVPADCHLVVTPHITAFRNSTNCHRENCGEIIWCVLVSGWVINWSKAVFFAFGRLRKIFLEITIESGKSEKLRLRSIRRPNCGSDPGSDPGSKPFKTTSMQRSNHMGMSENGVYPQL